MAIFDPTGESSTSGQGLPIMVPIPLFFQQSEMTHGTQNSEQCSRADYKWTGVEGCPQVWFHMFNPLALASVLLLGPPASCLRP